MKKKLLVVLTVALFVLPLILYAAGPTKDIKVKKIGSKKGPAIYSHKLHASKGVKKCKTCHHKGKMSDSCSKCHTGIMGKKAIHKNCIGCHKKMGGPKKCSVCHQKK